MTWKPLLAGPLAIVSLALAAGHAFPAAPPTVSSLAPSQAVQITLSQEIARSFGLPDPPNRWAWFLVCSPDVALASPRPGTLPPLKVINQKQAKIGFEVVKCGPSGLANVDVYATTDEGATWAKLEEASEVTLPVSAECPAGPLHGSVTVQLPRDDIVYGFYLVVKSRAGVARPAPAPGTPPQVRVEVDVTMPAVKLYRPEWDSSGQPGSIVLVWTAEDKNLATNPITLEWAASAAGPWELIGDPQLPNTGRYTWHLDNRVPSRAFLRLTARDVAGNVAVAQTSEPVLIDLTMPKLGSVYLIGP